MKNENGSATLRYLAWVGQLGFTIIMPLLLCVGAAWLLREKMGFGGWVLGVGIVLGLGGSFSGMWRFLRFVQREAERKGRKK